MKFNIAQNLRIFQKFVIDITCVEKIIRPYKYFSTLKNLKLSLLLYQKSIDLEKRESRP